MTGSVRDQLQWSDETVNGCVKAESAPSQHLYCARRPRLLYRDQQRVLRLLLWVAAAFDLPFVRDRSTAGVSARS